MNADNWFVLFNLKSKQLGESMDIGSISLIGFVRINVFLVFMFIYVCFSRLFIKFMCVYI